MGRIAIIQGHPDPAPQRFCRALAAAYAQGAKAGGHEVRFVDVASLDFPLLRERHGWEHGEAPAAIAEAQRTVAWAEHVMIVYPLWLGDMPALLKAFFEQLFRPGFALRYTDKGLPEKMLKGRSARVIVTMGMPGLFYVLFYRAHSVKSLERNILGFVGFSPVRRTVIGMVEGHAKANERWIARVRALGRQGR